MKGLYLVAILFVLSCSTPPKEETASTGEEKKFSEPYRPQYHFTPPSQWMNDPNGMVYYEGEYHLFYQHYPDSNVWGPMHWGHTVSDDMINWEHLPIALYPDSLGLIFSGSAVIDWDNSSGFGDGETPPMVAMFTHHLMAGEQAGRNDFQYQSLAFSLDKGRSWEMYSGNPVIPNPGIKDFRDPKVSWVDKINKWVMILAVKDHVNIYSSSNLKDWSLESEFGLDLGAHGGVWECPDLFPLNDQNGDEKWAMLVSINPAGPQGGSATQYFIGEFDGKTFIPQDSATRWLDYGADNYAGVIWSDVPEEDGRKLFIGWMSNWQYARTVPTTAWRSAMTLPRELKLVSTDEGYLIASVVVKEIESIKGTAKVLEIGDQKIPLEDELCQISLSGLDSSGIIELSNSLGDVLLISFSQDELVVDRSESGIVDFFVGFGARHSADLSGIEVELVDVYLDISSVEVFINDGELVMTDLVFPREPYDEIRIQGSSGASLIPLESIWGN